ISTVGSGSKFSSCWKSELIIFAGRMFPGKQPASPGTRQVAPAAIFDGSATASGLPVLSMLCEKLPVRSSAVGIVIDSAASAGWIVGQISCEKKKNSLSRCVLKSRPGMITGPPALYPTVLNRFTGLGNPNLLLKKSLALYASLRLK